MTARVDTGLSLPRTMSDHDLHNRGRKRDRDVSRPSNVKPVRTEESSTLRGRSRQRATSPSRALASRNNSPARLAHAKVLHHRIRDAHRQHCPSRPGATSKEQRVLLRRQRSRSRPRAVFTEFEITRAVVDSQLHSSLRNEVTLSDGEDGNGSQERKTPEKKKKNQRR